MERKPWVEYPHLWPTEASFWSFVRGCLRRGLWEKSPIKLDYKNKNCDKPPDGYVGRAKSGAYCALTGEWTGKSKLEVDHCEGHKSLLCWEDVMPFIMHLIPPPDSLQLVGKEPHKIKSHAERKGISFEEAMVDKKVIAICKPTGGSKKWLEERGIEPAKNEPLRKQQIRKLLEEEND